MQNKIDEIMGLVSNFGRLQQYNRYQESMSALDEIESKLRELVREPLSEDQIIEAFWVNGDGHSELDIFEAGVRYAERAHNITNTSN